MSMVSRPSWLNSKLIENGIPHPQLNSKLLSVDTKSDDYSSGGLFIENGKGETCWGSLIELFSVKEGAAVELGNMIHLQRLEILMALTDLFWKKIVSRLNENFSNSEWWSNAPKW